VVDLGGTQAAANPLRVPLAGLPAKTVARGYDLLSLPNNRVHTAADWVLAAVLPRQTAQLCLVTPAAVPLDTATPERIAVRR
jgi:NADH dehydrogenase